MRSGELAAVGTLPAGDRIPAPTEIWSARSVTLDMFSGAMVANRRPLFVAVDVAVALAH